jgi:hypothetical protein
LHPLSIGQGTEGTFLTFLLSKRNNCYYFIEDSCFLGQKTGKKMFLFKMFVHGNGSGYDLINWMQPEGDL